MDKRAVSACCVVVGFNILVHGLTHLCASYEALAVNQFNFQCQEETLSTGIVVQVINASN
jgi:hypothetical protein